MTSIYFGFLDFFTIPQFQCQFTNHTNYRVNKYSISGTNIPRNECMFTNSNVMKTQTTNEGLCFSFYTAIQFFSLLQNTDIPYIAPSLINH